MGLMAGCNTRPTEPLLSSGKPSLWAKLAIGEANEQREHEADCVAETVMWMPEPGLLLRGSLYTDAEDMLRRRVPDLKDIGQRTHLRAVLQEGR